MLGLGAMIGAGIFVLIGHASALAGPAIVLAFLLNAGFAVTVGACYAELAVAFPRTGGAYAWAGEAFGRRIGFSCRILLLGGADRSLRALRVGLWRIRRRDRPSHRPRDELARFVGGAPGDAPGPGPRTARVTRCLERAWSTRDGAGGGRDHRAQDRDPGRSGGGRWTRARRESRSRRALSTLHARGPAWCPDGDGSRVHRFEGYEIIAQTREEVGAPARTIPRAIFLAIGVACLLYIAGGRSRSSSRSCRRKGWRPTCTSGSSERSDSSMPRDVWRPAGDRILLVAGLASTASALNATLYSASRIALSMAREGDLPERIAWVDPKRRTPVPAIALTCFGCAIAVLVLPIRDVAAAANLLFFRGLHERRGRADPAAPVASGASAPLPRSPRSLVAGDDRRRGLRAGRATLRSQPRRLALRRFLARRWVSPRAPRLTAYSTSLRGCESNRFRDRSSLGMPKRSPIGLDNRSNALRFRRGGGTQPISARLVGFLFAVLVSPSSWESRALRSR